MAMHVLNKRPRFCLVKFGNLGHWLFTLVSHTSKIVACIGEQGFSPYGSEICGINFSPRSDRISVWIRRKDSPSVLSIGSVVLASSSQTSDVDFSTYTVRAPPRTPPFTQKHRHTKPRLLTMIGPSSKRPWGSNAKSSFMRTTGPRSPCTASISNTDAMWLRPYFPFSEFERV